MQSSKEEDVQVSSLGQLEIGLATLSITPFIESEVVTPFKEQSRGKYKRRMVMLTWETFISAWMDGCNDSNPDKLAPYLTDDFKWATSTSDTHTGAGPGDGLNRARTLELVKTGPLANGANESTIFESEDVLVGTHTITISGQPCRVMGVAKLRGDRVYEYHHSRVEL